MDQSFSCCSLYSCIYLLLLRIKYISLFLWIFFFDIFCHVLLVYCIILTQCALWYLLSTYPFLRECYNTPPLLVLLVCQVIYFNNAINTQACYYVKHRFLSNFATTTLIFELMTLLECDIYTQSGVLQHVNVLKTVVMNYTRYAQSITRHPSYHARNWNKFDKISAYKGEADRKRRVLWTLSR